MIALIHRIDIERWVIVRINTSSVAGWPGRPLYHPLVLYEDMKYANFDRIHRIRIRRIRIHRIRIRSNSSNLNSNLLNSNSIKFELEFEFVELEFQFSEFELKSAEFEFVLIDLIN